MPKCFESSGALIGMGGDSWVALMPRSQFSTRGSIEQRNTCLNCVIGDGMSLSECAFAIASTVPIASAIQITLNEKCPCFLDRR